MIYDICVLGLGYIGIPTAAIFATRSKKVLGVDVLAGVVQTINGGDVHIEEPHLDVIVKSAVNSGNLHARLKPEAAQTYIIAVPTPFKVTPTNPKAPDLTYVEKAIRSIAPVISTGNLVILESTSPVGTTELIRDWLFDELAKIRPDAVETLKDSVLFAHCPERILPGQMMKELVANDRIVGGLTPEAAEAARRLYGTFCVGEIFLTDARTAEMCKLTENAYRDVNIAFANELSIICDRLGINVWELINLANHHPRVKILRPGPGVGGHCIAVDPWFIADAAPTEARLIRTARQVNDSKPLHVIKRVEALAKKFSSPVIVCLGLAFKADIDDLRESPAIEIVQHLALENLGRIIVVEPHIGELPEGLKPHAELWSLESAIDAADVLVLLVDHKEFLHINRDKLVDKVVVDTRGVWQ